MAENIKATNVAKNNIKNAIKSPLAKILIVFFLVAIIGAIGLSANLLNKSKEGPSGDAKGSAYGLQQGLPTGGIEDQRTLEGIEQRDDAAAKQALANGESHVGSFVYEAAQQPKQASEDGFNESPRSTDQGSGLTEEQAMAQLRQRSAELDQAEQQRPGSRAAPSQSDPGFTSRPDRMYVDAAGKPLPYGISAEDFQAIAKQLDAVGRGSVSYSSLSNGGLKQAEAVKPAAPAVAVAANNAHSQSGTASLGSSSGTLKNKRFAVAAGVICPASAESAINTDFNIPVFFELLDCGPMTGVRARGVIEKTPSDFSVKFVDFLTTDKHDFQFIGKPEGISINIDKDGHPGIAQDVNNHWFTRIGSAAILSLAKTEKEFISARGTSVVTTGTSSSTTVDPLSEKDKNNARIAGLMEGTMDVVTRDTQLGVNRPATMSRERGTVIGIQFLSNIEIADK